MNLLLDTHIALWAVTGDRRLSPEISAIISNPGNEAFISVATILEIAIKYARNRGLPDDMPVSGKQAKDIFTNAGYRLLRIEPEHAAAIDMLPPHHWDPFDRMLIAQAVTEEMRLITRDPIVASYDRLIIQA